MCWVQVWHDLQSSGVRANAAVLSHFFLALTPSKLTHQQHDEAWRVFLDFRKDQRINPRLATATLTFCRNQNDGPGIMRIWKFVQEVCICQTPDSTWDNASDELLFLCLSSSSNVVQPEFAAGFRSQVSLGRMSYHQPTGCKAMDFHLICWCPAAHFTPVT